MPPDNQNLPSMISPSNIGDLDAATRQSFSDKRAVHLFLTGKGGVGKSVAAALLAQYLVEQEKPLVILDTDPVQSSLVDVPGLSATQVNLLQDDQLDVSAMDECIQRIVTDDSNFIVDVGAAGFVPFSSFMIRDGLFEMIAEEGKTVIVHTIVTGGPGMLDTIVGLRDMIEQFPACVEFIPWTNPFFGPLNADNGRPVTETPFWIENENRFKGVVHLPNLDPRFAGAGFREVLSAHMTIAEALSSSRFNLVAKRRLRASWSLIKAALGAGEVT